jgi:hypothetical protein
VTNPIGKEAEVKYVGLDWAYRSAQWCALAPDEARDALSAGFGHLLVASC